MSDNTPIDAVTEVAKSATSFAELAKSVLSPVVSQWETKAELNEIERKIAFAKGHPEVEFVIREDGKPGFVTSAEQEMIIRAGRRLLAEAGQKQNNLEQVYLNAANDVEDVFEASETPIDEDWLTRLNSIAQEVSAPEMQFVWGKILAGEYKKPGSFSFRTLETIRNISTEEAKLFESILPFVVTSGTAIFVPMALLDFEEFGIKYDDIIRLDECGLLNSSGTASLQSRPLPKCVNLPLFNTKNELLTISNPNSIELSASISAYPLTRSAIELIKILDYSSNHEFFVRFAEKIHKENYSSSQMTIYQIVKNEKGEDCFDTKKPVYTFCPITIRRTGLASQ
jgi:hypothetical protein